MGLTTHQQGGHTEKGPRFKVSSERPEKRGIDLAIPGLVVQRVIHNTAAAPIVLVIESNSEGSDQSGIQSIQILRKPDPDKSVEQIVQTLIS